MDEDEALKPPGSDIKMPAGSYRGKTYWTLLHRTDYYKNGIEKGYKSKVFLDFCDWVHEYYHVNDQWVPILKTDMTLRDVPAASSSSSVARPAGGPKGAPKKPPNPPLPQKCSSGCKEFSMQGSTGYTIRKTCRVCGWHTTDRRDREFEFKYEDCPHENEKTNNLCSSKTLSRTYCLQCGNFINQEPQEDRKVKKSLATAIMEAPNENLEVIHLLAKKSSQDYMSPAHASFVVDLFGGYVQEMVDRNEDINPVSMHRCLTQAIDNAEAALYDDPNAGYVRQGLKDPEHLGYMASDTQMTGDEVYLHLPEVDMWDSTSRDLFVALDEGCNTTCHSEAWASMAESKLKGYGLDVPWISEQGKSFLGLGASTKTQGQRTIPFALWLKNGGAVPGTMDSHQIMGPQRTPLLLSLYAQASLGFIKNMKKGTVMMEMNGKYQELELARCSSTGLLLLNITRGMDHVKEPFKCHRPYRSKVVDMAAMTASATLQCRRVKGLELPVDATVNEYLRGVVKANQCVVVTRSCDRQLPFVQGRSMISHDARYHFDPESMQFRGHVGRRVGITRGLLKHKNLLGNMEWLVEQIIQCPNLVVDIFCKSGRHRSVGEGTLLAIILEKLKIPFVLVHCESHERRRGWTTMRCGSRWNDCGWFNDAAYDEVVENSKPLWIKVVQMMERRMRPSAVSGPRRDTKVVDLDPAPAASSADGSKGGEEPGAVKELRGQLTKLTEMVEKLTEEKKRKRDKGSDHELGVDEQETLEIHHPELPGRPGHQEHLRELHDLHHVHPHHVNGRKHRQMKKMTRRWWIRAGRLRSRGGRPTMREEQPQI